jgi:hypothetical protein
MEVSIMAFSKNNAVRKHAGRLIVMPAPALYHQSVRYEKDLLQRVAALARLKRTAEKILDMHRQAEEIVFSDILTFDGEAS